jgi:hypothetical protein
MSDIRLHTLRSNSRSRNGYDARHDPQPSSRQRHPSPSTTSAAANLTSSSHPGPPMPLRAPLLNTSTAAAASSSSSAFSSSARRNKGRRRNEYGEGEPEEETTLLGEGEHDPGFLHDDGEDGEEEGSRLVSVERVYEQVRIRVAFDLLPLLMTLRACCYSDRRRGEGQRTNLGLFLYDHQVRRIDTYTFTRRSPQRSERQAAKQVSSQHCPQPKVQCIHLPAHRLLRAIQVLLQPLFPPRRPFSIRSCPQNRCAPISTHPCRFDMFPL